MILPSATATSRKIVSSRRTNCVKYSGAELGGTVYKVRGKNHWRCVLTFSSNIRFVYLTLQIYRECMGERICAQPPNACVEPLL